MFSIAILGATDRARFPWPNVHSSLQRHGEASVEGVLNQLILEHLQLAPLQWGKNTLLSPSPASWIQIFKYIHTQRLFVSSCGCRNGLCSCFLFAFVIEEKCPSPCAGGRSCRTRFLCSLCCFIIVGLGRHALDGHVLWFSLELLYKVIFKMFLECLFSLSFLLFWSHICEWPLSTFPPTNYFWEHLLV